jgi:hypothetical protein
MHFFASLFEQLPYVGLTGIIFYLAGFHRKALFVLIMVLSLLITIRFVVDHSQATQLNWMGYLKQMILLPFGLGAVIGFGLLPQSKQDRHLSKFTMFINVAVVTNILAMVLVPSDGTIRGITSRLTCFFLVCWLLQEITRAKGNTVVYERGFFIFRAVPISWVLCHGIYRMGLMSLPTFDQFPHLFFEPMSLGGTYFLYRLHRRRHPLSHYFGFSDTLVAPTMAVCASLFSMTHGGWILSQRQLDWIFVPIHLLVIVFAGSTLFKRFKVRTL